MLAGGFAGGWTAWWAVTRAVERTLETEYLGAARSVGTTLNRLCEVRMSFIERVATVCGPLGGEFAIAPAGVSDARLAALRQDGPGVRRLTACTVGGEIIADADGRRGSCPAHRESLLTGTPHGPSLGSVDEAHGGLDTTTEPLLDRNGDVVGVLIATFSSQPVDALMASRRGYDRKERIQIGQRIDDHVVFRAVAPSAGFPPLPARVPIDPSGSALMRLATAGDPGFLAHGLDPCGDRVVAAYYPVPRAGLSVIITCPRNKAFASLGPLLRVVVIAAVSIALITGLMMGWLIRSVSRPIGALPEAARQTSAGNLPARAAPRRRDEVGSDITPRRSAEERMRTLINAIEQSGDMVVITDTAGIVQYVNRAFEVTTGFMRDETVGHIKPDLAESGGGDTTYREAWATALGGQVWHGSMTCRKRSGETFEAEGTISPVIDANDNITHLVAVAHDVSEQRQLETQLQLSQRLEAAGAIAGNIAHDFNNLLTVILCNLVHVLDQLPKNEPVHAYLTEAQRAAEQASDLVHGLQVFSRRPKPQWRNHPVTDVIMDAMRLLRRSMHPAVKVRTDVPTDLPAVHTDPAQLHQAIANLCLNANDAMPDGGELTVRACLERRRDAGGYRQAPLSSDAVVRISIGDRGPGMTQAEADRVLKSLPSGSADATALGRLAITRGIVRDHGGWMEMHSRPGEGTQVDIIIPAAASAEAGAPDPARLRGQGTVLVVDREQMIGALLRTTLEGKGYRALTARDGPTALEALRSSQHPIDAAIVDCDFFDRASGMEMVSRLRGARPDLRILVTGGSEPVNLDHTMFDREGIAYLAKPFTPAEVLLSLKELTTDLTSHGAAAPGAVDSLGAAPDHARP